MDSHIGLAMQAYMGKLTTFFADNSHGSNQMGGIYIEIKKVNLREDPYHPRKGQHS